MMPAPHNDELTAKEKAFCEAYVECYDIKKAYLKAYNTSNIDTARTNGSQVLKRQRVKNYIAQLQKEAFERAMITPERIANKLADIAFAEKGDKEYDAKAQLKALDLLQKQMSLQNQNINANVETVIKINIEE